MQAVPITAFHNADPRLMADWATVEHATGVEPPAPPPAIDVVATVLVHRRVEGEAQHGGHGWLFAGHSKRLGFWIR